MDKSNSNNKTLQPVYRETIPYAREHGELDKYNADRNLNIECRDAINSAISEARFNTYHYKMKDAVKQVVDTYGAERVELIMAKIVGDAEWDGRYSKQNKEWAKSYEIPQNMKEIYSNTHPCLLDGFLERLQEKPSILEKLKNPPEQSSVPKPAPKREKGVEI